MKFFTILLIAFVALSVAQDSSSTSCGAGELACYTSKNGLACYFEDQYNCQTDALTGSVVLCGAGTSTCNDVCIADCAYTCFNNGTYGVREDRTCPPPPDCVDGQIACGEACYAADTFCCINSQPEISANCPSTSAAAECSSDLACNITFSGVGQLHDGQLRQNYGPGASEVSFYLHNGQLFDNRGQICYISESSQLQCNYVPQTEFTTGFCISADNAGNFLAYQGSTQFYTCALDEGENIYTEAYYDQCQPIFIEVDEVICPEETSSSSSSSSETPTSSSTFVSTSSDETSSSSEAPSTFSTSSTSSSEAPSTFSTSSTEASTTSSEAPSTTTPVLTTSSTSSTKPSTSSTKAATHSSTTKASTSSTKAATHSSTTSTTKPATHSSTTTTKAATHSTVTPSTTGLPPCPENPQQPPHPWCYFSFDFDFTASFSLQGGRCTDNSGNGHHGSWNGQTHGSSSIKKYGNKCSKDAGHQSITVQNSGSLGVAFSIASWISLSGESSETILIANTSSWSLELCPRTKQVLFHGVTSISWSISDISLTEYFHLGFTVDASGLCSLYKDGKKCGNAQRCSVKKHSGNFNVCDHKGTFTGIFDEFYIFDYCLSESELCSVKDSHCTPAGRTTAAAKTTYSSSKSASHSASSTKAPSSTTKAATHSSTSTTKAATHSSSTTRAATPSTTTKAATHSSTSTTKAATHSTTAAAATTHASNNTQCRLPWLYWSVDTLQHSRCNDDSGHGRHGTWSGPIGSSCTGKIRTGLSYSGSTSQCISLPKCDLPAASFSLTTWVKTTVGSSTCHKIASTKTSSNDAAGWELEVNPHTKVVTFTSSGSSKASWDCSKSIGSDWYHLSVSVSGSSVECFLNGVSQGKKSISKCQQGSSLWVGNNAQKTAQLAGSLDEFCLYDAALGAEEILGCYGLHLNVQKTTWAFSSFLDWGVDWEKSSHLSSTQTARCNNWWWL